VSSEPPGLEYLDDDLIGRSPILGHAVREGHHSLQVRLEGYQPLQRSVEIAPGKESVVEVDLDPAPRPRLASAEPPALGSDAPGSPPARAEPPSPRAEEAPALKAAEPVVPRGLPERPAPPVARWASKLPARYSAASTKDLLHALQVIENQAIADGAPAEVARDVTYPLAQELSKRIGPSEPAQLYPRAVYAFILDAAARGAVRSELAAQLRSAQLSGRLAANVDR
jgi:hypothetical protein